MAYKITIDGYPYKKGLNSRPKLIKGKATYFHTWYFASKYLYKLRKKFPECDVRVERVRR